MVTVKINSKGQITIPIDLRKQLRLHSGDEMGLFLQNDRLVIKRKEPNIEAAFGLFQAKISASLDDMEQAIRERASS